MTKWTENDLPDLTGKHVLITGAASGIGYETARAMAARGAKIILADINRKGGEQAISAIRQQTARAYVEFRMLDLSSPKAVQVFANEALNEGLPIDILVNNAGIQPISERRATAEGFELTFAIGHLGHFALTGMLLPLLHQSHAPRVVTVSSFMHRVGSFDWKDLQIERNYTSQRPYNQTKLANLLFAHELQRRAQAAGSNLLSLAVHPGVARTGIGANRKRQGALHFRDHLVSLTLALTFPLLGQPAHMGAWPTLYAATSPDVVPGGFYGPGGFGGFKGSPALTEPAPAGRDMETACRLWEVSEQLTGTRFALSPTHHLSTHPSRKS